MSLICREAKIKKKLHILECVQSTSKQSSGLIVHENSNGTWGFCAAHRLNCLRTSGLSVKLKKSILRRFDFFYQFPN